MNLSALRALTVGLNFDVFGVAATVTPGPGEDAISTVAIWVTPITEDRPLGTVFGRREDRRVLAFQRSAVPSLPLGARIVAPSQTGGARLGWIVDGIDRVEAEHVRAVVLRAEQYDVEDA